MSYPVKIGNAEVLVKSLDEAVELIAKYQRLQSAAVSTNGHQSLAAVPATVDLAEFVSTLPEGPQQGLRMIYQLGRGRAVSSETLRRELGLANNMALTGRVITPLTVHANRANVNPKSVLTTERKRRPDGTEESVYTIPGDSLEAVK
ncbi:MAG TPA: hypothetical protein VJS17_10410, partial [Pyrinomonadaceae bacterium]|nr:hypothetical protein [Pyrinomonadaceae bacterium]